MDIGTKETSCTRCIHREVCRFKEEYIDVLNAVDSLTVNRYEADRACTKRVRDIPFIGSIDVTCIHHMEKGEIRG